MKQEIIRLDQLTMGTIKYSDITLIQEKETEIISSDSLWRGIHEYYNGLVTVSYTHLTLPTTPYV